MKYDFSTLTNSQLSALIDDWIRDERNREILKDRFIKCLTFDEISDKYCICERHVKRIVYKYGDNLLSKIK
jgi:DNA-directed RNA polymerase specialized sigma subunit